MRAIAVDDEKLTLAGLCTKLERIERISEVHAFSSSEEALEFFSDNGADIAFLDINMPQMDGLELAARMRELNPGVAIIFVTGYSEYALEALKLHADGYLMKPVDEADIERELDNLERRTPEKDIGRIHVQCFGMFEVFADENPILFTSKKSKELLAILIDRRGASVTFAEAAEILWSGGRLGFFRKKRIRGFLSELKKALVDAGAEDILLCENNSLSVDKSKVTCDYYSYAESGGAYDGEYMSQYPWAKFA